MLKALIIDDEKRAREVLAYNLERHCQSMVKVVSEASNLLEGVELIKKIQPDLVFLDIEMPDYLGTAISSFFEQVDFEIIFVTAYSKYALKAFELSATDYLLKPIEPDRLKSAIEKVIQLKNETKKTERIQILEKLLKTGNSEKISIPYVGGFHIIKIEDIIMIKADGAYSKFTLSNKEEILISKNLSQVEKLLQNYSCFFRPHRSFIINLNHLKNYSYGSSQITLTLDLQVKLSQEKSRQLVQFINQK